MFLAVVGSFLFALVAVLLVAAILIQPAQGDMGLSPAGKTGHILFGGSGGRELIENITWALVFLFLGGALLLGIVKTKQAQRSRLAAYAAKVDEGSPSKPAQGGR